jgi:CheY-like chemotaxis protein
VETAHCGHEAITMIRNLDRDQLYDCVIAEEKMEDMSGRLLLMAIQPIYQQTSPPLVFLRPSGIWDPDHVMVESRKIGLRADAQLVKPLRPEQTLNMIERMVQENQRQDEVG